MRAECTLSSYALVKIIINYKAPAVECSAAEWDKEVQCISSSLTFFIICLRTTEEEESFK